MEQAARSSELKLIPCITSKIELISVNGGLANGKEIYLSAIQAYYSSMPLDEPPGVTDSWRTNLKKILSKDIPQVELTFNPGQIVLCGFPEDLHPAVTQTQKVLLEFLSNESKVPDTWVAQNQSVQEFEVPSGSQEWNWILVELQKTLPTAQLIRVQRIQHQPLWQKYSFTKKSLEKKNSGEDNPTGETWLWHGTRELAPEVIWQDEVGLDMRFCTRGMWGRALYFAMNASYSKGKLFFSTNLTHIFRVFLSNSGRLQKNVFRTSSYGFYHQSDAERHIANQTTPERIHRLDVGLL